MMRAIIFPFYLLLFFALSLSVYGQEIQISEDGEKIVSYEDGSWRYFLPRDSIYENNSASDVSVSDEIVTESVNNQINTTSKLILAKELASTYASKAEFERERYANIQAKKYYLEQALDRTKSNENVTNKDEIDILKKQLKEVKQKEKEAKKRLKKAIKKADKGQEVIAGPYIDQIEWYENELVNERESRKKYEEKLNNKDKNKEEKNVKKSEEKNNKKEKKQKIDNRPKISKDEVDFVFDPPAIECSSHSTIDELTGIRRRDTPMRHFFSFTHDNMLQHLKGAAYVRCNANFTRISGYTFMNIEIVVANEKANAITGTIAKGAPITFNFINGESLTLFNRRFAAGRIDPLEKTTTYLLQLDLNKNGEKMMKKQLLDQIRIIWSKGYEDYEVTNVDFLEHQIECLKNGS